MRQEHYHNGQDHYTSRRLCYPPMQYLRPALYAHSGPRAENTGNLDIGTAQLTQQQHAYPTRASPRSSGLHDALARYPEKGKNPVGIKAPTSPSVTPLRLDYFTQHRPQASSRASHQIFASLTERHLHHRTHHPPPPRLLSYKQINVLSLWPRSQLLFNLLYRTVHAIRNLHAWTKRHHRKQKSRSCFRALSAWGRR